MRRLIFLVLAAALRPLHAEVPALLAEALEKFGRDTDRWAYTQTTVEKDDKGRVKERAVVRVDPSKPYAEQYTPLEINGKPPGEAERKKYRRQGERRGERAEQAEREGAVPARKTLGELMDLDRATVLAEDAATVTYAVPLKKEGNNRLPPEKFLVTARADKSRRALAAIDVKLREPLRQALVVKVKSAAVALAFAPVDDQHAPPLAAIRAEGAGSVMFVPIGRTYDLDRADYKRVKPFRDRFEVQIGALKALDF